MKKLIITSAITLAVAVTLVLVASILRSITFDSFNPTTLANAFSTLGMLIAAISGVVLAGSAVANAIKGGNIERTILVAAVITAVGIFFVLTAAVLGTITWTTGTGAFNPTATNGFNVALNSLGYLAATLAGVVLVAMAVANTVKKEITKK